MNTRALARHYIRAVQQAIENVKDPVKVAEDRYCVPVEGPPHDDHNAAWVEASRMDPVAWAKIRKVREHGAGKFVVEPFREEDQ